MTAESYGISYSFLPLCPQPVERRFVYGAEKSLSKQATFPSIRPAWSGHNESWSTVLGKLDSP